MPRTVRRAAPPPSKRWTGHGDRAQQRIGPTPAAGLPPLDSFLAGLRGRRFFFAPVSGNNGDRLIEMGSRALLARHGLTAVDRPGGADLIVINGGYAMSDLWPHGFDQCRRLSNRHPNVPLLVLPSSFWLDTTDFPALFARRRAPLYLFCREPLSRNILRGLRFPCATGIGLDHDSALALAGSPWLAALGRSAGRAGHVLIVPRHDAERAAIAPVPRRRRLPRWIRDLLQPLSPLRDGARRLGRIAVRRRPSAGDPSRLPFVQQAIAHLRSTGSIGDHLPILVADISDPARASFAEFCDAVAGASVVYTERLHVGILAALLGKPTHLRAGNTHKIRGIYDHSLRGLPSVRMFDPTPVTTPADTLSATVSPVVFDVRQILGPSDADQGSRAA